MQSHQLTPIITAVTTHSAREDRAITIAVQLCLHDEHPDQVYIILLLLRGGNRFLNSQIIHTYTHRDTLAVFLC